MFRGNLYAISNENSPFLFRCAPEFSHLSLHSGDIAPLRTQPCHTLASMSSAAAADDAPEEFAALADYAVVDIMSEAASDVKVFATTEGHSAVSAVEIRFLARDPQAHDRVMRCVARLSRRVLRHLPMALLTLMLYGPSHRQNFTR